jgi:hypothetical protein
MQPATSTTPNQPMPEVKRSSIQGKKDLNVDVCNLAAFASHFNTMGDSIVEMLRLTAERIARIAYAELDNVHITIAIVF